MQKRKLLNTRLSVGTYTNFIEEIIFLSQQKKSSYVCVSNVHMVIEAYLDKNFSRIVNSADIATPDGMPLAKSMGLIYGVHQDRVAGMDLMPSIIHAAESRSLSIYFYGSTDDVLKLIINKISVEHPNLKIAGYYSPPFRALSQDEKDEIVNTINSSNPDFVLVALGCPKQEKWMAENKNKINSCMLGVGGAFTVYAGVQKRAPFWMQQISLEWLYRFFQEPKRLGKRYLVTNSLFSLLMVKFSIGQFIRMSQYNIKKKLG
ncbi:MAG: WecB/TagA/CpsF family glycosyltransferase [Cytophaga sp.]|uniref:WecB/TagA/CpsF family glycosyltransferase n=1 Tax=Cytophaga sp. TaxID=29535 RepID=UPI003F7F5658